MYVCVCVIDIVEETLIVREVMRVQLRNCAASNQDTRQCVDSRNTTCALRFPLPLLIEISSRYRDTWSPDVGSSSVSIALRFDRTRISCGVFSIVASRKLSTTTLKHVSRFTVREGAREGGDLYLCQVQES